MVNKFRTYGINYQKFILVKEKLRKYADHKVISHRKFLMDLGKSDKYIDSKGSISVELLSLIRNKLHLLNMI